MPKLSQYKIFMIWPPPYLGSDVYGDFYELLTEMSSIYFSVIKELLKNTSRSKKHLQINVYGEVCGFLFYQGPENLPTNRYYITVTET